MENLSEILRQIPLECFGQMLKSDLCHGHRPLRIVAFLYTGIVCRKVRTMAAAPKIQADQLELCPLQYSRARTPMQQLCSGYFTPYVDHLDVFATMCDVDLLVLRYDITKLLRRMVNAAVPPPTY